MVKFLFARLFWLRKLKKQKPTENFNIFRYDGKVFTVKGRNASIYSDEVYDLLMKKLELIERVE